MIIIAILLALSLGLTALLAYVVLRLSAPSPRSITTTSTASASVDVNDLVERVERKLDVALQDNVRMKDLLGEVPGPPEVGTDQPTSRGA